MDEPLLFWLERMDSDHRSYKATDLQSAPFGHSRALLYSLLAGYQRRNKSNRFHYKSLRALLTAGVELVDGFEPPTC